MQRIVALAILSFTASACGDASSPMAVQAPATVRASSDRPTVTVAPFFAVAECASDIDFDIRFGGDRVLQSHTTVDAQGRSHTTLHFGVRNFVGWALPETEFTEATADFDAQGGAEMFAIQEDASGAVRVRMHQGNLVFRSLSGDFRVIAHHTIREVPGQEPVSFWSCRLVG